MKLTVEKSLATIEEKVSINLLDKLRDTEIVTNKIQVGKHNIYVIENFLINKECNKIINASITSGFKNMATYDSDYRDSDRIIAFDKNGLLVSTINDRLKKIELEKVKPYGFFVDQYRWSNVIGINECLRVSRYKSGSKGFDWHRDAQYTHKTIRSVFSLVVYLSDCIDGGEIEFMVPKNNYCHSGYRMSEEIKLIKKYTSERIIPKKGMAIIFDQRLIHKAHATLDTKYVLRTDILVHGKPRSKYSEDKLELRISDLTKKLFRQAQYYELNDDNTNAKQLYEICLSLRQNPSKIKSYPKHLEKLLCHIKIDKPITNNTFALVLESRNGAEYNFTYKNISSQNDMFNALRICATIQLSSLTCELQQDTILYSKFFDQISEYVNIIKYKHLGEEFEIPLDKNGDFNQYLHDYFGNEKYEEDNLSDSDILTDSDMYQRDRLHKYDYKKIFSGYLGKSYHLDVIKNSVGAVFGTIESGVLVYKREQEHHCGLSDSSESNSHYLYDKEEEFKFNANSVGIVFEPITIRHGIIHLSTIPDAFNHASCNCDSYLVLEGPKNISIPITIKIHYLINPKKNTITMKCVPRIII